MNQQDQMSAYLLAKIRMLEEVLMLALQQLPHRAAIKADAELLLNAAETVSLNSTTTDAEIAVSMMGRKQTFDAIFHDLPLQHKA